MNIPLPFKKFAVFSVLGAVLMTAHTAFAWTVRANATTSGTTLSTSQPEVVPIDTIIFNVEGAVLVLDDARTYNAATGVHIRGPMGSTIPALYLRGSTLSSGTYISLGNNASTWGYAEMTSGYMASTTTLGIATGSGSQGNFVMSGGTLSVGTNILIATGSASSGTLLVSGGAASAAELRIAGGNSNSSGVVTVSGGHLSLGNLSFAAGSGASVGSLSVEGGTVNVSGTTTLAGNGKGLLQVSQGSFTTGTLSMGNNGKVSYLTVSNQASFVVSNALSATSGVITLQLQGASFNPDNAIIDASGAVVSLSDVAIRVNMTDYEATETQTITLMSYGNKPTENLVSIIGSYNESLYDVQSAVWGDNSLTLTINYIPEPSFACALAGLLALCAAARRRTR